MTRAFSGSEQLNLIVRLGAWACVGHALWSTCCGYMFPSRNRSFGIFEGLEETWRAIPVMGANCGPCGEDAQETMTLVSATKA